MIRLVRARPDDVMAWARLRYALWDFETAEAHAVQGAGLLQARPDEYLVLLAWPEASADPVAFVEAALRRDYVNGCDTSPVAFIEGIYVAPGWRGRGVARDLVEAVEQWGRALGVSELASDALIDNLDSHAMHGALGFEETDRVVYFRKRLAPA